MLTLRRRAAQGVRVMSAISAVVLLGVLHTGCGAEDLAAFEEAPEADSTAGWRNVYLGETYGVRQMWVERFGDSLIADGDILLRTPSDALGDTASPAQSTQGVTGEDVLDGTLFDGDAYRWPLVDNDSTIEIRYCIDQELGERVPSTSASTSGPFPTITEIEAAMNAWQVAMASVGRNVRFTPLNPNSHPPEAASQGELTPCPDLNLENLLLIQVSDSAGEGMCRTTVGKGNVNTLSCHSKLVRTPSNVGFHEGTIAHELGHSLGLLHEQLRTDRGSFVTVEPTPPPNDNAYGVQDEDGDDGASVDLGMFNHKSVMLYGSFDKGKAHYKKTTKTYAYDYRWRNGTNIPWNQRISMGDINAIEQLYWGAGAVDGNEGVRLAQGIGKKAENFVAAAPNPDPAVEFSPGSKVRIAPPGEDDWGAMLDLNAKGAGLAAVVLRNGGDLEITEYSDGGFWPPVLKTTELSGSFPDQPLVTAPTPSGSVGADLVVVRRNGEKLVTAVDVLPVRRASQQAWTVSKPVRVALASSLPPVQRVFSGDLTGDALPDLGFVSLAVGAQKGAIYVAVNQGGDQAAFAEPAKWAFDVSVSEDDGSSVQVAVLDGVVIAIREAAREGQAAVAWWTVPFVGALQYSDEWAALTVDGGTNVGLRQFAVADANGDQRQDMIIVSDDGVFVTPSTVRKNGGVPFDPNFWLSRTRWMKADGLGGLCPREPCHYGFAAIPGTTAGTDLVAFTRK